MAIQLEESANVREYLLGLDDLQQPKMIDMSIIKSGEWNSAVLLIARLILLKKGTYPDHPDLGIDIRARYRFAFDSELLKLQEEIQQQINRYLPEFYHAQVRVLFQKYNNKYCVIIAIALNQVIYNIIYDIDKQNIVGLEEL